MERKKIKIAMCANSLSVNGISSVIMNYCSNMDLDRFDISIIAGSPVAQMYRDKCKVLGIKIYELPPRWTSSVKYYFELSKTLRKIHPDIFHIHCNSATITIELFIAWMLGIKHRIAHSHNTTCDNQKIHKLLYPLFTLLCTDGFACGQLAGKWLFRDKRFYVMPNGFITDRFRFSQSYRDEIREKCQLTDKFVVGHIGRFNYQKNHLFLLKIFEKIAGVNPNAYLLLVGTGPDYDKVKAAIDVHAYRDRIILYGETDEVEKLYSAMDVFVMPSRYEGLPVALLEAQMSGLKCVVSDVITPEIQFRSDILTFIGLEEVPEKWAEIIMSDYNLERDKAFEYFSDMIDQYDIRKNVKELEKKYRSIVLK